MEAPLTSGSSAGASRRDRRSGGSGPVSRRDRPAKPPLTRDGIADAAFAIISDPEAPKLTLRLLAQRLDTGPASLYVYIRNLTELNALLIGRLLRELDLTWNEADEAWRPRLHRLLTDYSALLARYPHIAGSALIVWPEGERYLDVLELLMELLRNAGVSDDAAARAVDVLLQHATASAVERGGRREADEQELADLAVTLAGADPDRHPHLTRVGINAFLAGSPVTRSAWIIDSFLDGLLPTATATTDPAGEVPSHD